MYRNRTGEQIYKALAERLGGEKQASAKLRETGLPGMRYQDEKSRSMPFGYGTHNFVMFDDQFPEIVSRNGVSLSDFLKKDFYSRFGFVPNKGNYKDFSISESMYRPKK